MCLLVFIPPTQTPNTENLRNGSYANDDGFGYAIERSDGTGFIVGKSMKFDEIIDEFTEQRALHPNGVALFHERFTTHGNTNIDNVHPFYIGDDPRVLMAHNGVLPVSVPKPLSHMSDTNYFASSVMSARLESGHRLVDMLDDADTLAELDEFCSGNSKLVFLTTGDIGLRYSWYIIREQDGHWNSDDGCWYSNGSYKYTRSKYVPSGNYTGWKATGKVVENRPDSELIKCLDCGRYTMWDQGDPRWCEWCDACLDCGEMPKHCLCTVPDDGGEYAETLLDRAFGELDDWGDYDPDQSGVHGFNDGDDNYFDATPREGTRLHVLTDGNYYNLQPGRYICIDGEWVAEEEEDDSVPLNEIAVGEMFMYVNHVEPHDMHELFVVTYHDEKLHGEVRYQAIDAVSGETSGTVWFVEGAGTDRRVLPCGVVPNFKGE